MNLPNLKKQSEVEIIKLAPQSLTTQIYNKLKKSLINGDLKPGEKLKIDSLKDKYNSGHTPIREALTSLVKDGLVERIEQKGFVASNVSMKHFNEILKTRIWIEEIAIKKSMENKKGLEVWEENLILLNHRLNKKDWTEKYNPDNPDSWEMMHKKFHISLISRSGSDFLTKFCEQLYDQNLRFRFLLIKNKKNYLKRSVNKEHQDILNAVLSRDIDRAQKSLVKHYNVTGKHFQNK
ncbi:MAG: GntR family transcriptional regulator [Pelagibacteraceae bacterium]|nr:GntR family transcriptional regulator [Pelagibacteraceae bacterium]